MVDFRCMRTLIDEPKCGTQCEHCEKMEKDRAMYEFRMQIQLTLFPRGQW